MEEKKSHLKSWVEAARPKTGIVEPGTFSLCFSLVRQRFPISTGYFVFWCCFVGANCQ